MSASWLLRRLALILYTVFIVSVLVFGITQALPADAAVTLLGENATAEALNAIRERLGLGDPIWWQYLRWVGHAATGDFGLSMRTGQPVGPEMLTALGRSLLLAAAAILVMLVIAVPLGMLAALRNGRPVGYLLSGVSQVGVAVPAFLAAILLVLVFAVRLGWLPANGYVVPAADPLEFLRHMVLPWISLGVVQGAVLARYVRSAVLDELGQDYLRTARAKGLTPFRALARHGLRNASIPVLTVVGVNLVTVLVGAVIIERIFTIPGIGKGLADAAERRDLLTVQAIVVTLVLIALLISFLVDVAYALIDPRLRTRAAS